jgi:hypothetical protein
MTAEAEEREGARQEMLESDNAMRSQLGDITNLVQRQQSACETKKELMEQRWEDKLFRRQDKDARWIKMRDMMQMVVDMQEAERRRAEDDRMANGQAWYAF